MAIRATKDDAEKFLALSDSDQADLIVEIVRRGGMTPIFALLQELPREIHNDVLALAGAADFGRREEAFRKLKEATGGAPVSIFREAEDETKFLVLSQTANVGPGQWQLSDLWYFEDRGRLEPVGHTLFSSRDAALKSMVGIGGKEGPAVGYAGKYVFSEGRGYRWGRETNPRDERKARR